jgi:3-hydroxybutyryl-CoA dehydratase
MLELPKFLWERAMKKLGRKLPDMYFEEFEIGDEIVSPARTITETDIVSFAGLSGDYNAIHMDAVYAATTDYGERIAHGLLIVAVASGLAVRTGIIEESVIAFREINNWKFSRPVLIGDTIRLVITIDSKKALPRLGAGSLILGLKILNQKDESVMRGTWTMLVKAREA